MSARLEIVPCTIREANAFVRQHHRHHRPDSRNRFAVAVARAGKVCGVALVGNPRARMLQDGWTCEVTRCATDGTRNACSKLYSAAWRAAQQLGFRRCVTYILDTEHGVSLNAAGWRCIGKAGGGSWSRKSRPRVDEHPTQEKIRFDGPSPSGARRWHACPVGVRAGVRTTTLSESTLAGDWALIGEVKP